MHQNTTKQYAYFMQYAEYLQHEYKLGDVLQFLCFHKTVEVNIYEYTYKYVDV